jgi:acetyltransferase-like isoleucine patch superfamily enzyme
MGARSRTGAGAVVTRGTEIGEGETFVGVPARLLKPKAKGGMDGGVSDAR